MTREEIKKLGLEAGISSHAFGLASEEAWQQVERFVALVSAAEREAMRRDGWRRCAVGQTTTQHCALLEAAVLAEREACIKIIETYRIPVGNSSAGEMACEWTYDALHQIRDDIRARGQE